MHRSLCFPHHQTCCLLAQAAHERTHRRPCAQDSRSLRNAAGQSAHLNEAGAQRDALKELVEGQGGQQGADGPQVAADAERHADKHLRRRRPVGARQPAWA